MFWEIREEFSNELDIVKSKLNSRNLVIQNNLLSNILNYLNISEGKLFRSVLLLLSGQLGSKECKKDLIKVSTGIEFLHLATLIHDDIIDNSDLRRGQESINFRWNNKIALLVGDFFLAVV